MEVDNISIKENLEVFFSRYKQLYYKSGEILIRADDEPSGVYYLNEGIIRQYCISEKGDELVVTIIQPFDIFSLPWAINGSPNIYFYEALTPVKAWRAPKADFLEFIKSDPDATFTIIRLEAKHTERLLNRIANLIVGNVHKRLIAELIYSARLFGKEVKPGLFAFEFKVIERGMASMVGTTPETVSRELKILKDKELVTFKRNKLTIIDIVKLENELLNND